MRQVRARCGDLTATGEHLTLGAARDCDLELASERASRFHAELRADLGGIRVRDLGSTNGTFAAGVRVHEAVVPSGTELELGGVKVVVEDAELAHGAVAAEDSLGELITCSASMRRLAERIERASASDAPVVVLGEPGSGKELVARTLHSLSARARSPFVPVDCGALSPTLVSSELFGHERGAYTDADTRRLGAFERAQGGTLLLDEVAELPLELQPMLLGVLERCSVRRVGGHEDIAVDARIVASSARDLRREVNEGRFRLDLYYRLAVVRLEVPPLRERSDDLPALVTRFLDQQGVAPTHPLRDAAVVEGLTERSFEGNVRELRNLVEAALALDELDADGVDAQQPGQDEGDAHESTDAWIDSVLALPHAEARARIATAFERTYLDDLMRQARGNTSQAARLAGLDRSQLRVLLRRAGVVSGRRRAGDDDAQR